LTPAEQAEIDELIAARGCNVVFQYYLIHRREKILEAVKYIVSKGADVNAKSEGGSDIPSGVTPLHFAAEDHGIEVVEFLISQGADVNAKADTGLVTGITPLHLGIMTGNIEIVKLLVSKGANVHTKAIRGCREVTVLDQAKGFENRAIIEYLESLQ
jgi:ankyrin repeat protein